MHSKIDNSDTVSQPVILSTLVCSKKQIFLIELFFRAEREIARNFVIAKKFIDVGEICQENKVNMETFYIKVDQAIIEEYFQKLKNHDLT